MRHVDCRRHAELQTSARPFGHLFQGRLEAILVDRHAYLPALCGCVERNAVAAGLAAACTLLEAWIGDIDLSAAHWRDSLEGL